ncbi:poly-gamma-glutamate hydrolase family protein [Streptomyces sp. MNP-20]|uniref:poly-gamma-glutamate hydrolase family protein n=1 Tax=Streptomyces sp. MNP-20 TaxID=2721165 RepID=UPI0015544005|nr:poly-gamma-glutamate hydrolase family protein [Streptomyces sp. MNP-20]
MADKYANWAALAAAETAGVDYRLEVRRTPSRVSHIGIHAGGIEPGSGELANAVASRTGGQYYAMVATKPNEADNSTLHITSTHFDEPRALEVQNAVLHTVSYHGLRGTDAVTHLGGADYDLMKRVGLALEAAGFAVNWGTAEDVNGDSPDNIANRNRRKMGVQLEITRAQRAAFFPGGDLSQAMRESGQRTEEFWRYVEAIASVVAPLDATTPGGQEPGLDWGPAHAACQPSTYRVLFADLVTDRLEDVLPVQGLTFDDYIGKAGSLSGSIPVPDAETAARVKAAVVPGRTAVWVERDTEIWWGGILWTATPGVDDRGAVSVDIQAATFDSYLDHRILFEDLKTSGDQFDIARSLVSYVQAAEGGDLGIRLDTRTSGVKRTRAYSRYDLARVGELLQDLAGVDNGFEWRIACYRDGAGERAKALQLGYPTITSGTEPVMLAYPGNVLTYSWPNDATGMANVWQSRGATSSTAQGQDQVPTMSPILTEPDQIAAGWPRLDGSSDYNTVENRDTLTDHARADLARAKTPVTIPAVRVRLDAGMTPGLVGSQVRLRILDVWHADGLDARYRVVGIRVDTAERGREESAELYLEAV